MSGAKRTGWRAAFLLALLGHGGDAVAARAEGLFLFVIPTSVRQESVRQEAAPAPGRPLRVAVYMPDPVAFAEQLSAKPARVAADHVELSLAEPIALAPASPAAFLAESFLVDYSEPAVAALRAELVARHGPRPSQAELVDFVHRAVPNKEMGRGWDIASRVAATRGGDCTEHSVLLAALARSLGTPARVVVGAALVAEQGRYATLGHAWVELHDGTRWQLAEPTLPRGVQPLAYLPFGVLEDESPGYLLELAGLLSTRWIERVEVLGNEPSPGPPAAPGGS